ncbi:RNA binding protein [Marine Group I thaumarchaeote SCGC AAA799-E16]|uniref:RNA binding protein n=4 Tax=Marine Group I TaxID=905826 RepID=A0A081RLG8_9ARCH|nr:RNA binding protein [Marine Group I thaumarchaeote SCGC AAA799-N04]KER05678.1 RNA binding protein [Marine Group I thaumarchaeote SCGC AAA799-E16]KFM15237.1 RNA binding protein [Marine Group I thaumarchaeote SCGC AAA799-D11]KFM16435.1 RNA binding protein [Marine Group I thaumarchaeote SCGC RSA3]
MNDKIEITIDAIVHATEDISKIFQSFEILDLKEEDFEVTETTGHFENPILMLHAKIAKKQALNFLKKLIELLPSEQVDELIDEIEERTVDSRFHMRLDKQELVKGNVTISEKDTIKLKIHTPIYNKKDTIKTFTEIFQIAN